MPGDSGWASRPSARNGTPLHCMAALEAKLAGAIRGTISNSPNLSQALLLAAYSHPGYEEEKVEKFNVLRRRYEKLRDLFAAHPEYRERFSPLPFNSGYFMCIRIARGDAERVRKVLRERFDTGVIAQGDCLRLAFSSTPFAMIEKLMDNISRACGEAAEEN